MGDFETTVYKGQVNTEVWASAVVELYTEDVHIFHSIGETYEYLKSLKTSLVIYYHNLKFDGAFWLSYLLNDLQYSQAYEELQNEPDKMFICRWLNNKEMKNNSFKYSISDKGMWYSVTIKVNDRFIELRDSLKLIPFSVKVIGKSFGTKHHKLDMEYEGLRYAGCEITDKEKEYIANDVLVVKEALEIMFNDGHNKMTIGSCCLSEYKKILKTSTKTPLQYNEMFPDLYKISIDTKQFKYPTAGNYILKSYRGGWCYLVKGKENKLYRNGVTADVNSLYPSMMHSMSGNRYPIGLPKFWTGENIPDIALKPDMYYFIRVKTRFYLKDGYLPFIQIKGNYLYKSTEALATSDVYDKKTGQYYEQYRDKDGNLHDTSVELVLTCTDWILFQEHYNLVDCKILDGCYFWTEIGIFDEYIDKYAEIKMTSKGAKRTEAKLFLNNLYGKMASSTNSSFKVAYLKDDKSLNYLQVPEEAKTPGYIAVGSAITSYARNFTIRAAQKNYHGVDKPGFIYADTDSIHCDLQPEEVQGINVHPTHFCCWDLESSWDVGLFVRQKTYIEHVVAEELEPIDEPYFNVKCAGMPDKCKNLFVQSMTGQTKEDDKDKYTEEEQEFLYDKETRKPIKRELTDFKVGLRVPGKLRPVNIPGGVLLVNTPYEMR